MSTSIRNGWKDNDEDLVDLIKENKRGDKKDFFNFHKIDIYGDNHIISSIKGWQ